MDLSHFSTLSIQRQRERERDLLHSLLLVPVTHQMTTNFFCIKLDYSLVDELPLVTAAVKNVLDVTVDDYKYYTLLITGSIIG